MAQDGRRIEKAQGRKLAKTSQASRGVHHWLARAPSLVIYARSALQTQAVNCSYRNAGLRSGCKNKKWLPQKTF